VTQVFSPLFLALSGFDAQAGGGPQQQALEAERLTGHGADPVSAWVSGVAVIVRIRWFCNLLVIT